MSSQRLNKLLADGLFGKSNSIILILLSLAVLYNGTHRPERIRLATALAMNGPYFYKLNRFYAPSRIELYASEHAVELGLKQTVPMPKGCLMWTDYSRTIYEYLVNYRDEMKYYNILLHNHDGSPATDLRKVVDPVASPTSSPICQSLQVHPLGLGGVFTSGSLSRSPNGLLEPLFPPLRDPQFCFDASQYQSPNYLVHDFSTLCHHLLPTSKIVMIDLMHEPSDQTNYLLDLYRRFGFPIDTIYDFQLGTSQHGASAYASRVNGDPEQGPTERLKIIEASDTEQRMKRFQELLDSFSEDDVILVQIDEMNADDPASISQTSADPEFLQLLKESPKLATKLDVVYWRFPVQISELWNKEPSRFGRLRGKSDQPVATPPAQTSKTTVSQVMRSFSDLRQLGVAVHAWI